MGQVFVRASRRAKSYYRSFGSTKPLAYNRQKVHARLKGIATLKPGRQHPSVYKKILKGERQHRINFIGAIRRAKKRA